VGKEEGVFNYLFCVATELAGVHRSHAVLVFTYFGIG